MNENIEGVTGSCLAGVAARLPPPKVRDKADKVSAPPRPAPGNPAAASRTEKVFHLEVYCITSQYSQYSNSVTMAISP